MPEIPPSSGSAPTLSDNPYRSPIAYGPKHDPSVSLVELNIDEHLRRVAIYQKGVLLAFGINVVSMVAINALKFAGWSPYDYELLNYCNLVSHVCGIVAVGLLAARLVGLFAGICLAMATIVPCVNLLIVLVMIQKANSLLTAHDIRVGLFGARMRDFQDRRLERSH